jgi:hypothetical protein
MILLLNRSKDTVFVHHLHFSSSATLYLCVEYGCRIPVLNLSSVQPILYVYTLIQQKTSSQLIQIRIQEQESKNMQYDDISIYRSWLSSASTIAAAHKMQFLMKSL